MPAPTTARAEAVPVSDGRWAEADAAELALCGDGSGPRFVPEVVLNLRPEHFVSSRVLFRTVDDRLRDQHEYEERRRAQRQRQDQDCQNRAQVQHGQNRGQDGQNRDQNDSDLDLMDQDDTDGSQDGDGRQNQEGDGHVNQEYLDRASSGQGSLDDDDLGEEESDEWTSGEESGDDYDSQDERHGNIRLPTEIYENDSDLLRQMRQAAAYLERHEQGHIVLMAQGAFAAARRRLSDATLLAAAERTPWLTRMQRLRRLAPYVEPHCGNLMLELSKAFTQLTESEQARTKAEHSRDKLQRARDAINERWKQSERGRSGAERERAEAQRGWAASRQARHNAEKARSEAEKARSRAEQARAEAEMQRSEIESRFASVVEHCSFHHRLFAVLSTKLERMSATVASGQCVAREELRRLRKVVPSIPPCVIWPRALKRWERDGRCLS